MLNIYVEGHLVQKLYRYIHPTECSTWTTRLVGHWLLQI